MKQLLTLILSLIFFAGNAQIVKDETIISVPRQALTDKINIPFSGIKITDARFDQSKIGCAFDDHFLGMISSNKSDAVFPDSLKNYLPVFLLNAVALSNTTTDKLHILIKEFRTADFLANNIVSSYIQPKLILKISASFYAEKNNVLYKLFSADNILMNRIDKSQTRAEALVGILYKYLNNKNWLADTTMPSVTKEEIYEAVAKRFNVPFLTEAKHSSGLYKTFSEFKNNRPSITNVRFEYEDGIIENVLSEDGKKMDISEYWGVCDGSKQYIFFRGRPNQLIPIDHSFKFLSYRTKSDVRGKTNFTEIATSYGLLPALYSKAGDRLRSNEYFDVDMATGEVYLEELFGLSGLKHLQNEILK